MCLKRLDGVLRAAGIAPANMVHLNAYRTGDLPREQLMQAMRHAFPRTAISVIDVASLPFGVKVGVTGVAARDAKQKRTYEVGGETACASVGQTVYCAAQAADDVGEAARKIGIGLKALGTDLARAVANNVYLANIDDFAKMNAAYANSFPAPPPSRTTVQPTSADVPPVRLAVVAVR
jgi:enamine deaminase RidA (YjgF/YER057c/UK114 family)